MKDVDLSKLFGSKCRTKILEKFFLDYSSWKWQYFHMRLIARDIDEQINSVKRELDWLSELWILKHKVEAKKKYFYLNPNFPLIEEFSNIFLKMYNPIDKLKAYFKTKDNIELVVLKPSIQTKFTNPQQKTGLDIFIIWDVDKENLSEFLENIYYGRKVVFATITVEDFIWRLEFNDKMVKNLLSEKWNIFIKDTMKIREKLWI